MVYAIHAENSQNFAIFTNSLQEKATEHNT